MLTQSVKVQAASLFANASGSAASKGKAAGSSFEFIIGSSIKSTQTAGPSKSAADRTSSVKGSSSPDTPAENNPAAVNTQADASQSSTRTETPDTAGKTSDSVEKNTSLDSGKSSKDELTADDQVLAQITALLQSVQEAVMKALNLTSEEFNQLLTEQGMSQADLLEPQNLQQFILAGKGENSILAALTDEKLAADIKQLLQKVDKLKTDSNLELTASQIKSLLEQQKLQSEAGSRTTADAIAPDRLTEQTKNENGQPEAAEAVQTKDSTEKHTDFKASTQKQEKSEQILPASAEKNPGNDQPDTGHEDNSLDTSGKFQTFIENLAKSSQNSQLGNTEDIARLTELRQIASQIIERIKVSVTPEKTSMELQLNPENLGRVNLTVQNKGGVMTAHFVVQNEISKEAIESQINTLRDSLNEQGLKVNSIEVTVSANAFEQNQSKGSESQAQSQKNSHSDRQISLEEALSMSEMPEAEDNSALTGISGSIVDYTA